MTYNAGERKDVRAAEKSAKLDDIADREAITEIMRTTQGRAWMWRKLTAARCFDDPFSADALIEAYHKGFRNFGMMLLTDIMAYCPDEYITMTKEAHVRRINDDNRNRSAQPSPSGEQPGSPDPDRGDQGRIDNAADHGPESYPGDEDRTIN